MMQKTNVCGIIHVKQTHAPILKISQPVVLRWNAFSIKNRNVNLMDALLLHLIPKKLA